MAGQQRTIPPNPDKQTLALRAQVNSRLIGLRTNRYSWWVHWRELADFILPRRYRWLITPNMQSRGSPINRHILDSTGTLAARNLAAGLMTGCTDPTKPWFHVKAGKIDSTMTGPISLWLADVERIMLMVFQESNFYTAMATLYFDLVVFGTGVMIIYEDYDNVITCYNPCAGEYYLEASDKLFIDTQYREFTYTVSQTVARWGIDNVSAAVKRLWEQGGTSLTREVIIAHAIEPNIQPEKYGIPNHFKWREVYWEWSGSASPQGGASYAPGVLYRGGFYEQPFIAPRWDIVSNDAYGRSPGMDALPDIMQLQQEVKRKAQAIDKQVNPPMLADIQLKNQPASLLPGGVTYISGLMSQQKPGFAPAYQVQPQLKDMMEDLNEVRGRIKEIFFNNLFQTISQFETRSNVTAYEIEARRAEAMVMLGPVLERINGEGLKVATTRTYNICARAGIFPPAPPELQGQEVEIEFKSILEVSQSATAAAGIERVFQLAGNLASADPQIMDVVDFDYGVQKISSLLYNDPKLIRSPEAIQEIRKQREKEKDQQKLAQMAELAPKLAQGAQTLSQTDVGGSQNALATALGAGQQQ
ncbi:MAG TPA: portal protein [Candidatus Bathyarchaeia archaeon]|nr:portal protein [Candidatus Bathyarchaeia archaeon]